MTITRFLDKRRLTITQQGLTAKIVESYLVESKSHVNTPAGIDLFGYDSALSVPFDRKQSLMYLARLTRPDILLESYGCRAYSRSGLYSRHQGNNGTHI